MIAFLAIVLMFALTNKLGFEGNSAVLATAIILLCSFFYDSELFVLLALAANHNWLDLAPKTPAGMVSYPDVLIAILPILLSAVWKYRKRLTISVKILTFSFCTIYGIAVLNSTLAGQPMMLGLQAARFQLLFLYVFIFTIQPISITRLTRMFVGAGVALAILNNIQYALWGILDIFNTPDGYELMRADQLRFLAGGTFILVAPFFAITEFLERKKPIFLIAFIYLCATIFIQSLTRMIIISTIFTTFGMFFLAKRDRKLFWGTFLTLALAAGIALPMLENGIAGEIFLESATEISQQSGNIGIRMLGYGYYLEQIIAHPILGVGIWSDAYSGSNPENVKELGIHLSDVGGIALIVHTGLLGGIWLVATLSRLRVICFSSWNTLRQEIPLVVLAYGLFALATIATINHLTRWDTVIYLALFLGIGEQYLYNTRKATPVCTP